MKLQHGMMLSLVALVLGSCAGAPVNQQTPESAMTATASPSASAAQSGTPTPAKPTMARSGSFASGEHPTQGTVRLVSQNGMTVLELDEGFKTSEMGPDLVVILHRSPDVLGSTKPPAYALKEGDYTVLAPLQKFSGAQRYTIPATVNLADYQSAAIWCRKFNATFGAAILSATGN
jgi:Electron transfer DM13